MLISIVIPALNEAQQIEQTLLPLQPLRAQGAEIILVDGGSEDDTVGRATPHIDRVCHAGRGRARQMNAGAAEASGEALWFLHADTVVPKYAVAQIESALSVAVWGRFDVRLSGQAWLLRVVEWMMNRRSCWSGVATGDQGIFVRRDTFEKVGGFPHLPLMEDIAFSKRLRRLGAPACIHHPLVTSSRRWEQRGIVRTILLMWWLRFAYWIGVSPQRIAEWYR